MSCANFYLKIKSLYIKSCEFEIWIFVPKYMCIYTTQIKKPVDVFLYLILLEVQ